MNITKHLISYSEIRDKIYDTGLLGKGDKDLWGESGRKVIKEKYPLLQDYHIIFLEDIAQRFNLKGKMVLEIGGSNLPFELIEKLGVKKWISLDLPWWTDKNYPHTIRPVPLIDIKNFSQENIFNFEQYQIVKGISDDINEVFYNKFDFVVSNCCFEHIMNLPLAFENFYKALRKGGVLYASFSPIFSAYHGHHCWFTDEVGIKFNDLKYFPPHGHLLYSKLEIYKMLREHHSKNLYLDNHADFLKYGFKVNRHFFEDYEFFLKDSLFGNSIDGFIIKPNYDYLVSNDTMNKLQRLYPAYKRFDVGGIVLFGQKTI